VRFLTGDDGICVMTYPLSNRDKGYQRPSYLIFPFQLTMKK
jgi:hypothetical protein